MKLKVRVGVRVLLYTDTNDRSWTPRPCDEHRLLPISDTMSDDSDTVNDSDARSSPSDSTPSHARTREDVPDWDDEYVDRIADGLMHSYDLEQETNVRGESFTLSGQLRIEHQKHFLHSSINYANHGSEEYLFARRQRRVTRDDLTSLVDLGHELADEWIEGDETHYSTDFTFVLIAPEITDAVRAFASGFRDRTLLKLGYYGHYEIHLIVVAPEAQDSVKSKNADIGVFAPWRDPEPAGLFDRLMRRLKQ